MLKGATLLIVVAGVMLVVGRGQASLGTTTRVSVATDSSQANGPSEFPSVSADGRFVAFDSLASNLVPRDTNNTYDIFVHDSQTGETQRVSVDAAGNEANSISRNPVISGDGRYVVFDSGASNLVAGDTNGREDTFVHDRLLHSTERASVASGGAQQTGGGIVSWQSVAISYDGRHVAFQSDASNLVQLDTNGVMDIFVRDRQSGTTSRVSVNSGGAQADGENFYPSVSGDGRLVTFMSSASNLVDGDTNGVQDIFVHDQQTGETRRVSVSSLGEQSNASSFESAPISSDGRYVAFSSFASNLAPNDLFRDDVFVRDLTTGLTTKASVAILGHQGNGNSSSRYAAISADGRYVGFVSSASNVVFADANNAPDTFLYDRVSGATIRASVASDGSEANFGHYLSHQYAYVNGNGGRMIFATEASNLVANDTNQCLPDGGCTDVFLHTLDDTDGDGEWDPFDFTTDSDGDSVANPVESRCGSNPLSVSSLPERADRAGDDDGDGLMNEALPAGSEAFDCDGDGFTGALEQYVFSPTDTAHDQACANAWPPDFDNDGEVDTFDITQLTGRFGRAVTAELRRNDLQQSVAIDTGDIAVLTARFGRSCG